MATIPMRFPCPFTAILPVAIVYLLFHSGPRRASLPSQCDPDGLRKALATRGLVYEGRDLPDPKGGRVNPGFYLRNPETGLPWQELVSHDRVHPEAMRGCVVVTCGRLGAGRREVGRAQLGPFVLTGDPAEIQRILNAFRR
jgi:hypothetical protein